MICIVNPCFDPYFNIACEEFLLKHFTGECFMLWRNLPSIIIGKHQNTMAEINHDFVNKNNIPVIRRISGGGTVYHDLGNINFTFITNNHLDKKIHFSLFLNPIIKALQTTGITVSLDHRNNLFINKEKISGTAAHLAKNKVIHHGTLLFNSSVNNIHQALDTNSQKYSDKSIKSVRSSVTNIHNHLIDKIDISEFMKLVEESIKNVFNVTKDCFIPEDGIKVIKQLVKTKYKLWNWNYGYSPNYNFKNTTLINGIKVGIELQVTKGIIEFIKISHDISSVLYTNIQNALTGKPHEKKHIEIALSALPISKSNIKKIVQDFF